MKKYTYNYLLFMTIITNLLLAQTNATQLQESNNIIAYDLIQNMHEQFESINKHFHQIFNNYNTNCELILKSISASIDENKKENVVSIIVKNIESESFKAEKQGDSLTIETPNVILNVSTKGTFLKVETTQIVNNEINKEGYESHTETSSYSSVSRSLHGNIDFDRANIVFNKNNNELVIEIPFLNDTEKKTQTIPVTIK